MEDQFARVIRTDPRGLASAVQWVFVLSGIIFQGVKPTAVFRIMEKDLIIVMFHRHLTFSQRFVGTTKACYQNYFTTWGSPLQRLLVICLMLREAVIRANRVRRNYGVVISRNVEDVRSLDCQAYQVFAVTSVLRPFNGLTVPFIPLIKRFIASAPRSGTQIITRVVGRIRGIFLHPFVRRRVMAILTFDRVPFIGALHRSRRARFIADPCRFEDERVIKDASHVAPRIFRSPCLTASDDVISNHPRQARVIIVTGTLGSDALAV